MKSCSLMASVSLVALLCVATGCKPVCRVEIPNKDSYKSSWYGPEVKVKRVGSWTRVENYAGKSVYLEDIDLDILKDCQPCESIQANMRGQYNKSKDSIFNKNIKTLNITQDRNNADIIGYFKIGTVHQPSSFIKFIGHIAIFGPPADTYKLMFKLVDKTSNKTVFGYCHTGMYDPSGNFDNDMKALIYAIDNFNKTGSDGFWFMDCP